MAEISLRDYFNRRRTALEQERSTFIPHWQDLGQFVQPRRGRYLITDVNKGDRRYSKIINSKATQAHKIARAGMLSGFMSPSRPWFAFETPDPDLMDQQDVKLWLFEAENLIRAIFNQSNLYNMAPNMIGELLLFGTGCMTHVDDFDDVARFYAHSVGSYLLGQDARLNISTVVREYQMQVNQMAEEFGLDNLSKIVRGLYDASNYDAWVPVTHFIEPNPDHNPRSPLAKDMKFRSIKYETGGLDKDVFLSRKGYIEFPAYCPRWETTGEDIYGTNCPGMEALGDTHSLQLSERRKAQAIEKMVAPPLKGPGSLRNVPVANMAGGMTIYDTDQGKEGLAPIYTVNPQLQEMRLNEKSMEDRIDSAFFVNMFLAISNMDGIQPKNQLELTQRNEERLLQLGPALEQVHGEWLTRMIDRTFNQCVRNRLFKPAPPALQGSHLKVNYISSLALAQRAVATGGIDRLVGFIGGLVQTGIQEAADKLNADSAVDKYGQFLGTPPVLIRSNDEVAQIRQQRAAQQQAQQKVAMAEQLASAGQKAGAGIKSVSDAHATTAATNTPLGATLGGRGAGVALTNFAGPNQKGS